MFKWFAPLRMPRVVDKGQVFCPIQQGDVDVGRCLECPFLTRVVRDQQGSLGEIVCKPAYPTA